MKRSELKFSEYPFKVPNPKAVTTKFEGFINDLKSANTAIEADKVVKALNKYGEKISTQMSIISVKYSLDTRNPVYKKAQDKMDEFGPVLSNYGNTFTKVLLAKPYRKELEEKYGKYLFEKYENGLKCFDEKIIPELIQENKLSSEYDAIMGGAQIEFRGNVYNTSQLGKFMQDKDAKTREEAAIAYDTWLGENEEKIASIYSQLVTVRNEMAKKLGFKDFTEFGYLRLGRTDYNAKMVEGYRAQIAKEVVPICQKLYKEQIKSLGIKNPQYYDYNLRYKNGNATPAGGTEYLINAAKKMYHGLSKESGEYFDYMIDHELLDLEARPGKAPGGYCTGFEAYKAPFIFSNFNGTEGDVNVLTHEGGHAFQAYVCSSIKVPEYMYPTLETCEIHSMSMEFFAWPYMKEFMGEQEAKYRFSHLSDAIEFLPYGISVDEFQHWVYAHPNATHEERCAVWKDIESRYTPHKKYEKTPTLAKGTWWMRQGHIFSSPFYYIDYTLAQVVAFQFLVEDQKNHEKAWKKYVKFTKCGGKYPFVEVLAKNHLRNPFEEGNVRKNVAPLIKILKGFDTKDF